MMKTDNSKAMGNRKVYVPQPRHQATSSHTCKGMNEAPHGMKGKGK